MLPDGAGSALTAHGRARTSEHRSPHLRRSVRDLDEGTLRTRCGARTSLRSVTAGFCTCAIDGLRPAVRCAVLAACRTREPHRLLQRRWTRLFTTAYAASGQHGAGSCSLRAAAVQRGGCCRRARNAVRRDGRGHGAGPRSSLSGCGGLLKYEAVYLHDGRRRHRRPSD